MGWGGLFEEFYAGVGKPGQKAQGGEAVPAGVDVDTQAHLAIECGRKLGDALGVTIRVARPHLELEGAGAECLAALLDLSQRILQRKHAKRPRHIHRIPRTTTKQVAYLHVQRTRPGIVHGNITRRLSKTHVGHGPLEVTQDANQVMHLTADHDWGKILFDDHPHRLNRLPTPPRATRDHAFTKTDNAALQRDTDQQDRLRRCRVRCKTVGPKQRDI